MRLNSPQMSNSCFENFADVQCRAATYIQAVRKARCTGKACCFLHPLPIFHLIKAVKCFPVHLLSHGYLHLVSQEDKSAEVCLPRLLPTTTSATVGAEYVTLSGQECVSLLHSKEKKVTLFDDVISDTEVKNVGKVREREEMKREVRMDGGRQHEATTGRSAAVSSAPGKK